MDIKHLSYSSVNTLRRCGEQYRLVKVLGLKELPSWAQVGGSAVHHTTEARDLLYHFGIATGEPRNFNDALDLEIEKMQRLTDTDKADWKMSGRAPNKLGEDWWRKEGPLMVERWETWLLRTGYTIWISPDGEPGIEVSVEGELGGQKVVAYVDRVLVSDHGPGVVDLKSGTKTPDTSEQLGTYAKLLGVRYPDVRFGWGAYFMNREGKCTIPESMDRWISTDELDEYYRNTASIIQQELFTPNSGSHCDFMCGVKKYCRLKGGPERLQFIPSPRRAAE